MVWLREDPKGYIVYSLRIVPEDSQSTRAGFHKSGCARKTGVRGEGVWYQTSRGGGSLRLFRYMPPTEHPPSGLDIKC